MSAFIDLTNQSFGRLTVLKQHSYKPNTGWSWMCECECGEIRIVRGADLRNGHTISCGCFRKETTRNTKIKHGQRVKDRIQTGEYTSWRAMLHRVNNDKRYIDKGITVCDRWLDFTNFLSDMGLKPTKSHTIDRIDNSKGYELSNCRWATRSEQNQNRTFIKHLLKHEVLNSL